jgi:hypothetical protein
MITPKIFYPLIFVLFFVGCKDYNGGAIEIAWVIRGDDQRAYDCDSSALGDNKIDRIRLIIRGTQGEYEGIDICENGLVKECNFECETTSGGSTHRGVTSFSIPQGTWYIGLTPIDHDGNPFSSQAILTPEPVLTTIETNNLTFLGVWQMVVTLEQ